VNSATHRPKNPIKHTTNHNLGALLSPASYSTYSAGINQRNDALYYEVLEVSMSELEMRKTFKVIWLPEGLQKEECYEILVQKNGTVEEIVSGLQRKVNLPDDLVDTIRVVEVHGAKVHRLCQWNYPVANLNDYTQLYMEPTPEEDREPQDGEALCAAFHFDRDVSKPHGVPFIFLIKPVRFLCSHITSPSSY
jgi:ubiquitin carboxyl-terminal hydrolase 7